MPSLPPTVESTIGTLRTDELLSSVPSDASSPEDLPDDELPEAVGDSDIEMPSALEDECDGRSASIRLVKSEGSGRVSHQGVLVKKKLLSSWADFFLSKASCALMQVVKHSNMAAGC